MHLLGSHVLHRTRGLLQDGMRIGVGESEVDDLSIVTIVRHHDVRRFQVAMGYLLRMDVGESLGYLEGYLDTLLLIGRIGGGNKFF